MHFSVIGEYALQAMFDVAAQARGEPMWITDIARRKEISQKFLEPILGGVKQGGFVESRRGSEGGYLLARALDAIALGVRRLFESRRGKFRAELAQNHRFFEMWRRVDEAVSGVEEGDAASAT